uniref:CSON008524 protein n=1 Tax=Culicoides sonorensis TaxID=179676 RepID=A0A336MYP1_CULSO
MSSLINIAGSIHFITFEVKENSSISVCLTNFSETFKCEITKEEAITIAKKLNPHLEMNESKIISTITQPTADDVSFCDNILKFKYKIAGVPYRFTWNLVKTDTSALIFPLLDALLRIKKQILDFRKLPNSDPMMLGQLPIYGDFNITNILNDFKSMDVLSKTCASKIKIKEDPTVISPIKSGLQGAFIKPRRKTFKKSSLFNVVTEKVTYESSDGSQPDSQPDEIIKENETRSDDLQVKLGEKRKLRNEIPKSKFQGAKKKFKI